MKRIKDYNAGITEVLLRLSRLGFMIHSLMIWAALLLSFRRSDSASESISVTLQYRQVYLLAKQVPAQRADVPACQAGTSPAGRFFLLVPAQEADVAR